MLLFAVDDRTHRLLYSAVLGVDAVDPGESVGLLDLTVDHPIVRLVAVAAEAVVDVDVRSEAVAAHLRVLSFFGQRRVAVGVVPVVDHDAFVVDRHPMMSVDFGKAQSGRTQLSEWHDEVIAPHVPPVLAQLAHSEVAVAVVRLVQLEERCAPLYERALEGGSGKCHALAQAAVHYRRVGRVHASFEGLKPVALLDYLGESPLLLRHAGPLEVR